MSPLTLFFDNGLRLLRAWTRVLLVGLRSRCRRLPCARGRAGARGCALASGGARRGRRLGGRNNLARRRSRGVLGWRNRVGLDGRRLRRCGKLIRSEKGVPRGSTGLGFRWRRGILWALAGSGSVGKRGRPGCLCELLVLGAGMDTHAPLPIALEPEQALPLSEAQSVQDAGESIAALVESLVE